MFKMWKVSGLEFYDKLKHESANTCKSFNGDLDKFVLLFSLLNIWIAGINL